MDDFSSNSFTSSIGGSGSLNKGSLNGSNKLGSGGSGQYASLETSSFWLLVQVSVFIYLEIN